MAYVLFAVALLAVVTVLGSGARWVRRSGRGGGVRGALAAYEEVFHASGRDRHVELQEQQQRTAPAPRPRRPPALSTRSPQVLPRIGPGIVQRVAVPARRSP